MKGSVEIIGRELIKPSSPTPPDLKHHKLSLLDLIGSSRYIPLLLFYKNQDINPTISLHLKHRLPETLTEFYPLAGKLILPDLLTVDCDDSGALFVEAKVDAPLSQTTPDAPFEHFLRYLPTEDSYTRNEVLLAVQITMFRCGGWIVGACMNHRLGDLSSFLTFLNSWAAISRGEYSGGFKKPDFETVARLFPSLASAFTGFSAVQEIDKVSVTRFVFNREKLIQLKQLASESSTVKEPPTGVEVVTAFLCQQFIGLRGVKKANHENPFCFGHAVSLRSKILKDGEKSFPFGNAVIFKRFSWSTYADLVSLVSSGLKDVDQDYVVNSAIPELHKFIISGGASSIETRLDWYFSSWCRSPIYEVDFGWGKPICAGSAARPNRGLVTLMSTRDEEGIEAWVGLLPHELPLLSQDLFSLATNDSFSLN